MSEKKGDLGQIRRAHASARPKNDNPAWLNCHHDCAVLLAIIDKLEKRAEKAEVREEEAGVRTARLLVELACRISEPEGR